jgi:hypothetical protein
MSGGAILPHFSGHPLDVGGLLGSVRAAVLAALPAGDGFLDVGGAVHLVPVPYHPAPHPETRSTSFLIGGFGVAGYRQPLSGGFSLAGEVDLGLALWSGLDAGNPFTVDNAPTDGPLTLPSVRLAGDLLYRVSRPLWLWVGPSYQLFVPVSKGLREVVSAVHLFELSAGVAVQL